MNPPESGGIPAWGKETTNDRAECHAAFRALRMDAVAALSAGAPAGRIYFGHRRLLVPPPHAGGRDPHHRDGGGERLPQRGARQASPPQRPPPYPAAPLPA